MSRLRTATNLAKAIPAAVICSSYDNYSNCARFSQATYPANDPSEDRLLSKNTQSWSVAAVFDGHGGWQVSDFVHSTLMDKVLVNLSGVSESDEISIDDKIFDSFVSVEEDVLRQIKPSFGLGFGEVAKVGSCVLLALKKNDRLIIANCGDCRAVLGTTIQNPSKQALTDGYKKYISTRINRDHNARVALEQLRLEQEHKGEKNLFVCKNPHACYVKGRLQLTRSIGDVYLKYSEFNGAKDRHRSR